MFAVEVPVRIRSGETFVAVPGHFGKRGWVADVEEFHASYAKVARGEALFSSEE